MGFRRSKYGAVKTKIDGVVFASKKEAKRYRDLRFLLQVGDIYDLQLQPKFPVVLKEEKICTYIGDFKYKNRESKEICEDVKGMKTPVYNLKIKLVKALYPEIEFREV